MRDHANTVHTEEHRATSDVGVEHLRGVEQHREHRIARSLCFRRVEDAEHEPGQRAQCRFQALQCDVSGEPIGHDDVGRAGMHEVAAFDVADEPGSAVEHLVDLLAQLVALARLLADRQQPNGRLVDVPTNAHVLAAHARRLHEPLGRGINGCAGIDEELRVITRHGDGHRDRRPGHTFHPSHAQQRRRHRGAGVAGADHRVGSAVAHGLRAPYERRVLLLARGTGRLLVHRDHVAGVEDLDLGRAGLGQQRPVQRDVQAGRAHPLRHGVGREAEPQMRVLLAQEFKIMRREVDDQQPPLRAQRARGLGDRARTVVEEVQNLMDDDDVEGILRHRQLVDVALAYAAMLQPRAFQPCARQRQHVERHVDAEPALDLGPEQFEHAARSGAEIEEGADRPVGERCLDRALDRRIRDVEPSDAVPFGRVRGKIALRRGLGPEIAMAEIDHVQVGGEDPVLRPRARQLDRKARLDDLPLQRLLAREVEVAHELLRDGRAALDDVAGAHIGGERPEDPDRIDPAVLVEAPVLDGDGCLRHPRADSGAPDGRPVLDGGEHADQAAVRAVDERAVGLAHRSQRAQVAARAEVDGPAGRRGREHGERNGDREDDESAAPPPRSLLRLGSPLAAHVQTPSARSRLCARNRSSCSRRSAAAWSPATARTVTVAVPLSELR